MKNISLKENINFDKKKDINDYELFSLKIAINLYESSTNALSQQLTLAKLVGLIPTLVN